MHHISRRQGLRSFFEHAAHRLATHIAQPGLAPGGALEFDHRPALAPFGWRQTCQRSDLCLRVRVVHARAARASHVQQRQLQATLQVRRTGAPQGRPTHAQHRQDLRLRHASIQARQHVRPVDLPTVMTTLAADLFDNRAVFLAQMQFRLAHEYTSVCQMATCEVYSCSVTYVSLY